MDTEQQAAAFVAAHPWSPLDHATYLAELNQGMPFCTECADWHHPGELHSAP